MMIHGRQIRLAALALAVLSGYELHGQDTHTAHFGQVFLAGSATEDGQPVPMSELRPNGQSTGVYEAYMKARPGELTIQGTLAGGGSVLSLGRGATQAETRKDGLPFVITQEQVVRVRLDTGQDSISILPVSLYLKGNIVKPGTQVQYDGHGVWKSRVEMNHGDVFLFSDKYFYFAFNNDDALAVRRVAGSRTSMAMPSEGFSTENIRVNRGTYTVTLDMARHTWDIDAPIDENRISAFGSSVCNGEGAAGHKGYAYMYGQQLAARYSNGDSPTPFYVSGVSIGGNSTLNLLARYDEMLHDFGRYVIIGLSLGNEGIHGAANQAAIFNQFRTNMLTLISKCRKDGKIPVVMNNYTRGDYNRDDHSYVKQMNLDIHRWEVPSVNALGAIDNGEGKWADGYMRDTYHQDTEGHREFMYAIPPSLFDALRQGKPYPVRDTKKSMTLRAGSTLQFAGEGTVHPFTVALRVKGSEAGRLLHIQTERGGAELRVVHGARIQYVSTSGDTLCSAKALLANRQTAYDIAVTHYYAQQRTLVYVDNQLVGEVKERMSPTLFTVGDDRRDLAREYSELSFWRSGMTMEELAAHHQGSCMKSSLELYTPLAEEMKTGGFANLAQSLNFSLRHIRGSIGSSVKDTQVSGSQASRSCTSGGHVPATPQAGANLVQYADGSNVKRLYKQDNDTN